ncbi:MAG TPA: PIG-L family deacetylase [Flavobacterium sp.]|jgi:LmbE family N-acetylglucosaminyl deacetylase
MRKLTFFLFAFFAGFLQMAYCQQPAKPNSSEIYNRIRKLNFLGSVLYIAAHPDDENTRLISYFSNQVHARAGYLSLTRGDGGQNLIGTELRELLGVIRTQELLEARKIDGGVQFFSRANDFGYSKVPDETMMVWNRNQVLADVVWAIRKFRPDIIINRFDSRTPGSTHGHHTASAMLSLEGFDLAAKATAFPEQLNDVNPWQPKRAFFNTSFWFYGGKEKFDKADKSALYNVPIGKYFPELGKSNQEIAALSRSRHQSQGFGSTGTRGEESEFLELIKGDGPKSKSDLFEGIDTSWSRVEGGTDIGKILNAVEKNYDFRNPSASIPELLKAYNLIEKLQDEHWKRIKLEEIKEIIAASAGLYLEAVAETPDATPGSPVNIRIEAINRSTVNMSLSAYRILPSGKSETTNAALPENSGQTFETKITLPQNINFTQPYWLMRPSSGGMYVVDDQKIIGTPDVIREVKAEFTVLVLGIPLTYEKNVIYKYNDDVKGEVYEPFDIVPAVSASVTDKVSIFNGRKTKNVMVTVRSGKENAQGKVSLSLPANWQVTPSEVPFNISRKGAEQTFTFEVTPPKNPEEAVARAIVVSEGQTFTNEQIDIRYPHISKQMVLKPAEARFISVDIRTGNEKIAYIMGAGDEVNKSLTQMGYEVTVLKPQDISTEKLAGFDVVITGIRAYNTIKELSVKQPVLLDFVKSGKTMIVQYNTLDDLVTKEMSPFPLKISRDRVTEENAPVKLLDPEHPVLNYPNKITEDDFKNWKQEQGLYYPSEWDKAFTPLISSHDKGESAKNGALLVSKYGKGHYIYTGLSFFRELPEGVTGAFRLMANLISAGK